ncbi:GNAT family N-acetyltransferase [Jidongwangia harbinensis]|uniref:GNAT family N-acetyltransferase n=1 Tax=Jidongwangia harbinensis TaxID=2878561 RepID=UPI001CDA071A|nr:GNAT family N-acetyltransferase [Jidongwangia harbinensis]MCA2216536.1 GNAT family N-acetyltransferase [Jidongwangia harbinensis]
MEIRQITADERTDTMFPLQAYAFTPSPWPDPDEAAYRHQMQFYRDVTSLVAEEDGQALACVAALPMRQNVRGVVHDMAGIASVASHPTARRRGLVRQLMTRLMVQMRDQGCAVSALYPFRPSFYGRLGYVGLPRLRRATFPPESVSHLLRIDLPGTVERRTAAEAFDEYDAFTRRLLGERHGFSVFDPVRAGAFREDKLWVAMARVDGEVVGAVRYRIDRFGGDLVGEHLLTTGPLGRALLLQYFARHVDQVSRVMVSVDSDAVPDLWGTDMAVTTEGRVAYPSNAGPMARVLNAQALEGTPVGEGGVTVEVVDGPLITGVYRLESEEGRLRVAVGGEPQARLSAAGFSGLVYGVLDPVDVLTRGLGEVDAVAFEPLRALFPRSMPYLFSDF